MQKLKWVMGLNVVLGVLVYRGLLTFQPTIYSASSTLTINPESYMFVPSETAPLMIVLISMWLLYHRRAALFALPKRGGPIWLVAPALVVGFSVYAWAIYTRSADIQAISLIANLVGCAILWRGLPAVRVAIAPILLLLFAIPLPSPLIATLIWQFQLWTAVLAGWMLYVIGIPAVVSGEIIQLPMDTYQVIETCSGLRSVQTLAMFSILMANLFDRGKTHGFLLFAFSIPIAFVMNGFRVVTLILNPHSEIHSIHVAQGLMVLMGGLIVLYATDGLLARLLGLFRVSPTRSLQTVAAAAPRDGGNSLSPFAKAVAVAAIASIMLGVQYGMPTWRFQGQGGAGVEQVLEEITDGAWVSKDLPEANNDLGQIAFRQAYRKQYSKPRATEASAASRAFSADAPIEVFWGVGEHLDRFRTPFTPKTAFPGRGWVVEDSGQIHLAGTESEITWRLLKSGTHRVISYHWYEESQGLLRESLRSFFAIDRSPFSRELPVMAIRMATEIEEVTPGELKQAHDRLAELHQVLAAAVDQLKQRQHAARRIETSRLLDFPLWETFFPSFDTRKLIIPFEYVALEDRHPVA